jgi:hypothetical protein
MTRKQKIDDSKNRALGAVCCAGILAILSTACGRPPGTSSAAGVEPKDAQQKVAIAHADTASPEDSSCPRYLPAEVVGTIDDAALKEISGLIVENEYLWVHNDSGNQPLLFHLALSGLELERIYVQGPDQDWEDIAVDRSAEVHKLYIADFGDNNAKRDDGIAILEVPVPLQEEVREIHPRVMRLSYPDGPRDAETLLIDPTTGELVIVTKPRGNWPNVYTQSRFAPGTFTLEYKATLYPKWTTYPLHFVTAGDISADGSWIVLRTYAGLYLFPRLPGTSVSEALTTTPCELSAPDERQGEAVAFGAANGTDGPPPIFTISEGRPTRIHRLRAQP